MQLSSHWHSLWLCAALAFTSAPGSAAVSPTGAAGEVPASRLPWAADPPVAPSRARAAAISALGRQLFFDAGLSGSGRMSCATCHSASNHFAPQNALSVQMGGAKLDQQGTRATPSLAYAATTPFFSEHYYESDDEGDESVDEGPTGGRTWDGRVNRPRDQAAIPLLAHNEMDNPGEAALVERVSRGPHAAELRRLFGDDIFRTPARALQAMGDALEAFQETPAEFSPFTSKYDAYLLGKASLSASEMRGLEVFRDPARGNCSVCHRSEKTFAGRLPLFTDFGFQALGVPRNSAIAVNADPNYFDLGACGPQRKDLAGRAQFCGMFKTPSLRNVATRRAFYHNGVFHTLEDAVAFYATRDTNPERWYPPGPDGPRKFDDLPDAYRANVNTETPFGGRQGDRPTLSPRDVADIVAFLRTLTDGYFKPAGAVAGNGTTTTASPRP